MFEQFRDQSGEIDVHLIGENARSIAIDIGHLYEFPKPGMVSVLQTDKETNNRYLSNVSLCYLDHQLQENASVTMTTLDLNQGGYTLESVVASLGLTNIPLICDRETLDEILDDEKNSLIYTQEQIKEGYPYSVVKVASGQIKVLLIPDITSDFDYSQTKQAKTELSAAVFQAAEVVHLPKIVEVAMQDPDNPRVIYAARATIKDSRMEGRKIDVANTRKITQDELFAIVDALAFAGDTPPLVCDSGLAEIIGNDSRSKVILSSLTRNNIVYPYQVISRTSPGGLAKDTMELVVFDVVQKPNRKIICNRMINAAEMICSNNQMPDTVKVVAYDCKDGKMYEADAYVTKDEALKAAKADLSELREIEFDELKHLVNFLSADHRPLICDREIAGIIFADPDTVYPDKKLSRRTKSGKIYGLDLHSFQG